MMIKWFVKYCESSVCASDVLIGSKFNCLWQVVYGDIVDACHAVKSRRITVDRHPCIFIEWYHEYLRTRPYASVTQSEDSCCEDTVCSTQQPACPASGSHCSSTHLAPIRVTLSQPLPPATADVYPETVHINQCV